MPITADVPVIEDIAVVLFSRLQGLLVAGTYQTTASEIIRPLRLGGYTPKDWQVVLTQGETKINEELSFPGNPPATAFETRFDIRCHVMPSEGSSTALATLVNQIAADIRKVVCATGGNAWSSFGGNAIDASWPPHEQIISDGSFGGVNVPIEILYRTREGDPYTLRT